MRGARYVRLIPWTLHSGSEQLLIGEFTNVEDENFCLNLLANFIQRRNSLTEQLVAIAGHR
jgi:hypothetical protein